MRSKKNTQLNKTRVHQIKTRIKRNNTNKTKKNGRFTQKAGAGNNSEGELNNLENATPERRETTVERALREQRELEEKIKEEIKKEGYDTQRITQALKDNVHKEKKGIKRKTSTYDYKEVYTYGKAEKNSELKKIAIEIVTKKNPKLEKDAIEIMAIKLLNYVHNQYIEEDKNRYELLFTGLNDENVQKSLEKDDEFMESYVDRMNKELQRRKESGEGSKSSMFEFFKLASGVFDKTKLSITEDKIKDFKELLKGTPQENRFVLFFQNLNKESGGQFTTSQIERKVELMFRLYKARTTVGTYFKVRTPWFTPLSVQKEQMRKLGYKKASSIQKSIKRSLKEFQDYEECSLIKELSGNERSLSLDESFTGKLIRKFVEGDFFKKEDKYFLGLLKRNTKRFCFQNKEGTDDYEYSRFCKRITKCLKTPNLLHELLFDAIDAKATKRMYDQLSTPEKESLRTRIQEQHANVFKEKLDENADERDTLALLLTLVQDENLHSLSKFFKQVIIQTFLDYKESSGKAPQGTYTGNIVVEPYFDDIFKLLTEKQTKEEGESVEEEEVEENNGNNQEGGSKTSYKDIKEQIAKKGGKSIFTLAELKRISEDDLYKGLKSCDKKDLLKSEYEKRTQEGTSELGDEFDKENEGIDSIGEGMETPKLLYILMGSLIVVGVIESGFLDAPPCMTHTII
jgi:hypothetical protein